MTGKRIFSADIKSVPAMMNFVDAFIKNLPEKAAYNVRLSCEEVILNIVSYAYPGGDGQLDMSWEDDTERGLLNVTFEDSGVPFNPLQKEEPDLTIPMRERKIGGLGIMMVRKLMDEVRYAYVDGKNRLTITKGY
jgi:anti-sigma regulatory factor (Ser/Thr protein kinase)